MPNENNPEDTRFHSDARNLFNAVVKQEDISPFQQEIQSMTPKDRLEFIQALDNQRVDTNLGLLSGKTQVTGMKSPLVSIEAVRSKETNEIVDLDVLIYDNGVEGSIAKRLDLFDPKDGSGKEIDQFQQAKADAGAYEQMDNLLRNYERQSRFPEPGETHPRPRKEHSSRFAEISKHMSEQIADPEQRQRAQDYLEGNLDEFKKYEYEHYSGDPQYSLKQLPQNFQDLVKEPLRAHQNRSR